MYVCMYVRTYVCTYACMYVHVCMYGHIVKVPFLLIIRAQTEEMLKQARADQVQHKKHFLAVQAARDRAEFDQVLE